MDQLKQFLILSSQQKTTFLRLSKEIIFIIGKEDNWIVVYYHYQRLCLYYEMKQQIH